MSQAICPKCGQRQSGGNECYSCGVVFARYRPRYPGLSSKLELEEPSAGPSTLRKAIRVLRWVSLCAAILIFALILQQPAPPALVHDPFAEERVERKLEETRRAVESGRPHVLALNEAEVNSWLGDNLVFADNKSYGVEDVIDREASLEQVQNTVRNMQVNMKDDEVSAHVVFDFHGKDLKLEVRGKLMLTPDRYLRLTPTGGRLGALPIPSGALHRAVSRVFNSPENREKFRVPDHVDDLRIERGELKVVYR